VVLNVFMKGCALDTAYVGHGDPGPTAFDDHGGAGLLRRQRAAQVARAKQRGMRVSFIVGAKHNFDQSR
jgi:hypothetical protein